MWQIRKIYYSLIKKFSSIQQIEHFTGAGLYDRSFIKWLKILNDPLPSLRGMVVEYGYKIEQVTYTEEKRKSGKRDRGAGKGTERNRAAAGKPRKNKSIERRNRENGKQTEIFWNERTGKRCILCK